MSCKTFKFPTVRVALVTDVGKMLVLGENIHDLLPLALEQLDEYVDDIGLDRDYILTTPIEDILCEFGCNYSHIDMVKQDLIRNLIILERLLNRKQQENSNEK